MNGETLGPGPEELQPEDLQVGKPGQSREEKPNKPDEKSEQLEISDQDQILGKIDELLREDNEGERELVTQKFIEDRVGELANTNEPTIIASPMETPYQGFIHSESGVSRSATLASFRVDDNEIYNLLVKSFKDIKENFRGNDKSLRHIVPDAVLVTINRYFGNVVGNQETGGRNVDFYIDHSDAETYSLPMKEFKGKNVSVCVERAATAQNLLSFLGYKSELIISSGNRLNDPDKDDPGAHAFNVISTDNGHFIFDATNPVTIRTPEGKLKAVKPANYKLREEEYQSLETGGKVEVTHNNMIWDRDKFKNQPSQRLYAGPKDLSK